MRLQRIEFLNVFGEHGKRVRPVVSDAEGTAATADSSPCLHSVEKTRTRGMADEGCLEAGRGSLLLPARFLDSSKVIKCFFGLWQIAKLVSMWFAVPKQAIPSRMRSDGFARLCSPRDNFDAHFGEILSRIRVFGIRIGD